MSILSKTITGLVICGAPHEWNKHIEARTFSGFYRMFGHREIVSTPKIQCPNCDTWYEKKKFLITEIDPDLEVRSKTVRSFPSGLRTKSALLSSPKDGIRTILDHAGFKLNNNESNEIILVYETFEGYKAVFHNIPRLKTQKLFLILPKRHRLFGEITKANVAQNAQYKASLPLKPKPIEVAQDCIGSRVKIGDWCAFSSMGRKNLQVGQVVKFTIRSVWLRMNKAKKTKSKLFTQIVKLPDDQVMVYMLGM